VACLHLCIYNGGANNSRVQIQQHDVWEKQDLAFPEDFWHAIGIENQAYEDCIGQSTQVLYLMSEPSTCDGPCNIIYQAAHCAWASMQF